MRLDRINLTRSNGEPMAYRVDVAGEVCPAPCSNVDGIGPALEAAAYSLLDLIDTYGATAWLWAGPVQDDEHPDVCEASYRLTVDDDDVVHVQGLDPAASGWLHENTAWVHRPERSCPDCNARALTGRLCPEHS